MTFQEIISNLRKRIFHTVYLLTGDEPYYIDEIAGFVEKNVLSPEEREFNQLVFYGRDTNMPSVISHCKRYPMIASHFVVIVREAQDLESLEGLESYLAKPLASTILVLCYKYKKFDGRTKLAKKIKEKAIFFESAKLYDNKIPGWIETYLQQNGMKVTPKAAEIMAEYLGSDLGKIVNELQKLLINLAPGTIINDVLVEQNIGISKDFNVFEFQKALGHKNIFKANLIANYFAANPRENHILKIIPILYYYFLKLMIYHQLDNKNDDNAAKALGVNPFILKDYKLAAQHYDLQKLGSIIGLLRQYDLRAKGVDNESTSDGELLKEMVYKILH
ncbi:MAG: DNA polymerase III subunit delta [Bacteroidales bacterium]|nr:DNA polymerase III subunit delta [Bacteroidales bacterium]MDZ4204863.1 DNA polymerase III subunit delta [Bacteroidales bacterium]